MKASNELVVLITKMVTIEDTTIRRAVYKAGDFPRADRVKDLNVRYRWDLYWLVKDSSVEYTVKLRVLLDNESLDDTHIYTVLKRAIPNLTEGKDKGKE